MKKVFFVIAVTAALALNSGCGGNDDISVDAVDAADVSDTGSDLNDVPTPDAGRDDSESDAGDAAQGDIEDVSDTAEDSTADTTDGGPGPDEPPFARFINPFIGSDSFLANVGNTFPGPGLPFGMVRLSPDTGDEYGASGFQHCGGYRYSDLLIYGFSHNHLHGTGAPDYGNILVMPIAEMTKAKQDETDFAAEYDKASEKAEAGYYAVTLTEPAVKVELTATTRCGYHRYTWPQGTDRGVLTVDYGASLVEGRSRGGDVSINEDGMVEGVDYHLGDFAARFDGFDVFFVIKFDRDISKTGVWKDGEITADTASITIPRTEELKKWGGWFEFDLGDDPTVEMQVCLSYSSIEAAKANMAAELPGWDFDATRTAAFNAWEDFVDNFRTTGGSVDRKINFYTALYHSAQMPQIWNDVTGDYRGFDKQVHKAEGWSYYTDLSLWDTFRTQQPLIALVWPEVHRDINRSMLEMARQSGNLPKWALAAGDTGSMIGQHAATVVVDSYLKGITDFEVEETYDYLKACAEDTLDPGVRGRRDRVPQYNTMGYIPADLDEHSVSITLEYAFNDYCLAELARELGKTEDESMFRSRSTNFKNLWDPNLKFFREKNSDGNWTAAPEDYDPTAMTFGGRNQGYTEGSGWQYRWFAPHDPDGLIELFGGEALFIEQLIAFFQNAKDNFDFMIPQGWYFHGNEPDIHSAFMFINAGRPDLTQYWARWILDNVYRNEPGGLIGNDDAGTLAAWYVFTASGLYPSPCIPGYFITTPAFDRTVISLPGGDLTIEAEGASDGLLYISSAEFNGQPMEKMWIDHSAIVNGGTITLHLSDTPPNI